MHYLILSIICSTAILVIFRYVGKFGLNTFNTIIINYFVASILGMVLSFTELRVFFEKAGIWMVFAIIIGVAFVVVFYIMAMTTQKMGVTVSSIASRMSVIIPFVFSIIYENETIGLLKISGITFALFALYLMIFKESSQGIEKKVIILPILLFIGVGTVDSAIKYSQVEFMGTINIIPFSTLLFTISAISALTFHIIKPKRKLKVTSNTLLFGILLGAVNFGSLYFFVNALAYKGLDSSVIFGINNVGIVMLSILIGLIIFKESLNIRNWLGILLAVITIIILSIAG